jgi:Zn-dependent oligopeptidase
MKYRTLILGPGGSKDSDISLKEFLGREPNDEAFMRQNGFAY